MDSDTQKIGSAFGKVKEQIYKIHWKIAFPLLVIILPSLVYVGVKFLRCSNKKREPLQASKQSISNHTDLLAMMQSIEREELSKRKKISHLQTNIDKVASEIKNVEIVIGQLEQKIRDKESTLKTIRSCIQVYDKVISSTEVINDIDMYIATVAQKKKEETSQLEEIKGFEKDVTHLQQRKLPLMQLMTRKTRKMIAMDRRKDCLMKRKIGLQCKINELQLMDMQGQNKDRLDCCKR